MNKFLILCIPIIFLFSCREKNIQDVNSNEITIGTVDSLFSKTLHEQRKIWVHVPQGAYNSGKENNAKYPVVYLLDGETHFSSVVGMIQQLSAMNGNTLCPEMIVVGITNTDRTRDLTPTRATGLFDNTVLETSGGAENFTKFIEEELMPYVDKNYPTTTHRMLIGHSYGGLFVINTLFNRPSLFTNYLAIDPSLWWDKRKLSTNAMQQLDEKKFVNKHLFVAVANTMKPGMKVSDLSNDTTMFTEHIRAILQFTEAAKAKTNSSLNINSKYYAEDNHGSVPLIAAYDAIRYFYAGYTLTETEKYFDPNSKLTADDVLKEITTHYEILSTKFGYNVRPPEALVNELGYSFLFKKLNEKALAVFKLNIQNYPASSNVYDSMGDYYIAQKDTANAIENFTKALSFSEVGYTREKLVKLKSAYSKK